MKGNMKLQFFANISHELRTPLSLIINPLEEFFVDHPEYRKGILDMVKQNADYLLELINQLLDFRKLDAGGWWIEAVCAAVMIILGIVIAGFVVGLGDTAEQLSTSGSTRITTALGNDFEN